MLTSCRRRLRAAGVWAVLTTFLAVAPAGTAPAADTEAPPGAPPSWLPDEPWVLNHWLPYRESDLYAAIGGDRKTVVSWTRGGRRTLGELVRARGLDPRRLASQLVAPWRGRVSKSHLRVLRRRANRTMTQAHLVEHMLGHLFHAPLLAKATPRIFGTSNQGVLELRRAGLSRLQIGLSHGLTEQHMKREAIRVLHKIARTGVDARQLLPAEAKAWVTLQVARVEPWLRGKPNWGQVPDATSENTARASSNSAAGAVRAGRSGFCRL